ncbi:MAG: hypothetical protein JW809_15085 [Pirellulales bacterium]|nr:hypothetical protein [Pirellulales bacterium]
MLSVAAHSAQACDTPVYRYALYNWAPAPHHVFYLHRGGEGEDEPIRQVNRLLVSLSMQQPPANLVFKPVDMADPRQTERLPRLVADAWDERGPDAGPLHLVVSPWGHARLAGRLDEATLGAMLDSPARREIAQRLAEGNAAVFVVLDGGDPAENDRVRREIDVAIRGAAALGSDPAGTAATTPPRIALVGVARSDPAETWFVEDLTSVEPDLKNYADEPIVFAVYGRGRIMLPYVGRGITSDNLLRCVAFLGGPCACEVKEDNPGADLLFRWDWEATADALAAEDDSRPLAEGQLTYDEFVPDDVRRPGAPDASSEDGPSDEPSVFVDETTEPIAPSPVPPPSTESFAGRQLWLVGAGSGLAAVVILLAGTLWLRRH